MPKIKIKVSIVNDQDNLSYEVTSIICDGILKYREPDNTMAIFNYENKTLTRENEELKMTYWFDNKTQSTLFIKDLKKEMTLTIITDQINIKENNIEIKFKVEENNFEYKIEEIT